MSSLSTHVLDTERGIPAVGVPVTLYRADHMVANAQTDAAGRISQLASDLGPDTYRLTFDIGAYLAARGSGAPFLQRASVEFRVDGSQTHYHVPLLITPFGCTAYRGG